MCCLCTQDLYAYLHLVLIDLPFTEKAVSSVFIRSVQFCRRGHRGLFRPVAVHFFPFIFNPTDCFYTFSKSDRNKFNLKSLTRFNKHSVIRVFCNRYHNFSTLWIDSASMELIVFCYSLSHCRTSDSRILLFTTESRVLSLTVLCVRVIRSRIVRYLINSLSVQPNIIQFADCYSSGDLANNLLQQTILNLPLPPHIIDLISSVFNKSSRPYYYYPTESS